MAIQPINGFYVHDEVTNADGVALVSADAVAGYLAEWDVPIDIGYNRFISDNGILQSNAVSPAIRASTAPRAPIANKIYVVPATVASAPYRFAVGACMDNAENGWTYIQEATESPAIVDLAGVSSFFIQILRNATIPSDAVPIKIYTDLQDELDTGKELNDGFVFSYPLSIEENSEGVVRVEVGINRYLDNAGNIARVPNVGRSSTPPFSVMQFDKVVLEMGFNVYGNYTIKPYGNDAYTTPENYWHAGRVEIDTTGVEEMFLQFRCWDGSTMSSVDEFGVLTCYSNIAENLAAMVTDINKESMWSIGSLGSNGEDYDLRQYEIRTKDYIDISALSFIKFASGVSYSFCVYDESKVLLNRFRVMTAQKWAKSKVLNLYPTAKYYRLSLWTDETAVQDVSHYSLCKIYHVGGIYKTADATIDTSIVTLQERKKQEVDVFKLKKITNETYGDCDLKCLFVSDIHGEQARTRRAIELVNAWGTSYFDAVINGGDTCVLTDTESLEWYNSAISPSVVPVLNTIGNHDAWSSLGVTDTDPKVPYNLVIAPVASSVSIVQPANAAANGYNYYYKDFNSTVRVIVIDCMFWDATQKSWFDSVLSDANTNGLHVVCVTHAAFPWANMETVDCLWSKAGFLEGYSDAAAINDPTRTNIQAAASIKDFMDAGGNFVCWLTGHQHGDDVHVLPDYSNQFVVTVPSFAQRASMIQKNSNANTYNYDVLTYVAVDTSNKNVKFLRIGANIDMYGVEHNGISIDYKNNKLIASW